MYIYVRTTHDSSIVKMGKTTNLIDRESQYKTYEHKINKFILMLETTDIELLLQSEFKHLHSQLDGGVEFYQSEIVDLIVPFLVKSGIEFKIVESLEGLTRKEKIFQEIVKDYSYQELYVNKINEPNNYLIKLATGGGKTVIYHKIIKKFEFKKVLFMSPRKLLNIQLYKNAYHFSERKTEPIKTDFDLITTCCYQSLNQLLQYCNEFELVVFDECHTAELIVDDLLKIKAPYKIFGSATPLINFETKFIKLEFIQVYELINRKILCEIETVVKKLENNKTKDFVSIIIQAMKKYNKKKGIIYTNSISSAEKLKLALNQFMPTYIISAGKTAELKEFESNKSPCLIVNVNMISYGYDNYLIDLVCIAESRNSPVDIRQIIGRVLRTSNLYPNKVAHILLPLYKDEFNSNLKIYLDFILNECGYDLINKHGKVSISKSKDNKLVEYELADSGEQLPIEVYKEYSTTNYYSKYSNFRRYMFDNNIVDRETYNKYKQEWMPLVENLKVKYKQFNFKELNKINPYYDTYELNEAAKNKCLKIIAQHYTDLSQNQIDIFISQIDKKICLDNLWYPNQ